ncbi:MAG: ribosomal protein S6 modification protein [Fimbriimonadales bacterium]|nr:MAG: ribosomal protein S6 modification protein [Fimbriimonadales bacterium]
MKKRRGKSRVTVGWREWVSLPELGIEAIKAKIDTGARTSSLHAFNLKRFRRDGVDMVRFDIHPIQRDSKTSVTVEAPLVGEKTVRSSSGHAQKRPVIETTIVLCGIPVKAEVTLTRRDVMGFRMLIGRKTLAGRFLVDPKRSYLGGKPPEETRKPAGRGKG